MRVSLPYQHKSISDALDRLNCPPLSDNCYIEIVVTNGEFLNVE